MKSEEMYVNSKNIRLAEILDNADAFAAGAGITGNDAVDIRLLVEETLGMMSAMAGEYNALLDFECDNKEFRINLVAKTEMDVRKKQEILSVSTSGKNASVKGFMGMIGDIIENGLMNKGSVWDLEQDYDGDMVYYGSMGIGLDPEEMANAGLVWSLSRYKNSLADVQSRSDAPKEAFDDLEKSVVASIAKDVIVGVKKDKVHLTIVKDIKKA